MDSMFSIFNNVTNDTKNATEIGPTSAPNEPAGMVEKPFYKWFRVAAYSFVWLSGVFGNLMVIFASRKPGMITVSNILIANLAVADFHCLSHQHSHRCCLRSSGVLAIWQFSLQAHSIPARLDVICFSWNISSHRCRTILANCSIHEAKA